MSLGAVTYEACVTSVNYEKLISIKLIDWFLYIFFCSIKLDWYRWSSGVVGFPKVEVI